ncbi:hypothetical protein EDB87DRAFT_1638782 [Lactarius vividus]|nr:hypothetical protein EDB87DRAFT_1638782 [Lactarius vividus]
MHGLSRAEPRVYSFLWPSLSISTLSFITQRFSLLFLAASVALSATIVPVEAVFLGKREINAQRFSRALRFLLSGGLQPKPRSEGKFRSRPLRKYIVF